MITIVLLLALSATSGCFNPDLTGVIYSCPDGRCPDGLYCDSRGLCVAPPADQGASTASDLGGPLPDLSRPFGCASGKGTVVGDAYACPKSYNPGGAARVCAAGYVPCTKAPTDLVGCGKLPGFFLASIVGRYAAPGDLTGVKCSGSDYYRVVYGCGDSAKGRTAATACGGLAQLIDCQDPSSGFQCPGGPFENLDNMTSPYPSNGVLCCAP